MIRQRIRLRFRKQHDLRYLGHRDLLRTFERLFRRAGLPLSMSEGFHPKPRFSFPSALPVGVAGTDEVMELELAEQKSAQEVLQALLPHCPAGFELFGAEAVPPGTKKPAVASVTYEIPIPPERRQDLARRIEQLHGASSQPIERPGRKTAVDLIPLLEELSLVGDRLRVTLRTPPQSQVRAREVLVVLGLEALETEGYYLTRTKVNLARVLPAEDRQPATARESADSAAELEAIPHLADAAARDASLD